MFQNLTLIPSVNDFGQFAEMALFYDKVQFQFNEDFYNHLQTKIDPVKFINFLMEFDENFQPFYRETMLIQRGSRHGIDIIPGGYTSVGDTDFLDYCYDTNIFGDITKSFVDKVRVRFLEPDIISILYDEFQNYNVHRFIALKTGIDLDALKNSIEFKKQGNVTIQLFLSNDLEVLKINRVLADYFASLTYTIEASKTDSDYIANTRGADFFSRPLQTAAGAKQIATFNDLTLPDTVSVRNAINKGKSLEDFIALYKNSTQFKQWLLAINDDEQLIKKYLEDTVKKEWSDRLPTKTIRWSLFAGIGLGIDALGLGGIGTATGIALGAFDTFVLDKLIHGWRPNHFVEQMTDFSK